jgi:imidazolonepropionase-like amidohydrolase
VLKCDGADACRKVVRYQVEHGVDWIKVYADRSYKLTARVEVGGEDRPSTLPTR